MDQHALFTFEQNCQEYPDQLALIYLGESYSYAQLKELSDRFATALHELGVRKDDKVFIYLPNCVQWVIAYLAILEIGATAVPVSPIYTPSEITYMINDSGAETIICQDTNFGYVKEVLPQTVLKRIIYTRLADMIPLWKRVVGLLFDRVPRGSIERGEKIYSFKVLIAGHPPRPPRADINPRQHPAYILYTGGTTGLPKGVPGTHSFINCMINDYQRVIEGYIRKGTSTLIMVGPLFHIMGQATFLSIGLGLGNRTVLMPIPEVDSILKAIEKYRVDLLAGVPALYRMILENDRLDLYDLSSLKYCWSGGDVLPTEIFNRWRQKFNVPIYQNFGATETGFVAFSPMDQEPSPNVIGFPVTSKKIKVVDPDSLEPVAPDRPGELLTSSEYMVRAYWNKPEETAAGFVELDGELYYRMRDLVQTEEDGQLSYVDRGADIIKYKGYRVSCSEIEAVLQDHEAVMGACVIGVPDPKVGERIKAMVVIREGVRGVGATDLIRWCRERLAPYKVPYYIEFRDMLPKSKVGKLLRREVRDEERRRSEKGKRAPSSA
ncbi:MAG: AMP-binding protein [Deltaproteobacteria bacterium]|nr:MAG: AMP-binding protein [Deltaproteobacteria bacterium]